MGFAESWQRYKQFLFHDEDLGISLDISRMNFGGGFIDSMNEAFFHAMDAMEALEGGVMANPDEARMVGHYWLRAPELAPNAQIRDAIDETARCIKDFAARVHSGDLRGGCDEAFSELLLIGIGGSALGPQLVADALGTDADRMRVWFMDNTDPDGIARTLNALMDRLDRTLVVVISKSGGTAETRNGMNAAEAAYSRVGLNFADHAVAVTSDGSKLSRQAREQKWLDQFPMWDWIGGRTSVLSAVGLLPAALQGLDIDGMLDGARKMDALTRRREPLGNPAAMLALMWHFAGNGHGARDMVILPYKDRLILFSRYLQQLIMESLGKEKDLEGNIVNQGLSVYGNKGSTDQHAYVQQLRDGLNNFFVTFIEVLADNAGSGCGSFEIEPGIQIGDYLEGFLLGTRSALTEKGRESMTITIRQFDARGLGALIALFERAVGLYASMIHINAYHQPGVEAGKKAAQEILELQAQLTQEMAKRPDESSSAEAWAAAIGKSRDVESVFKLLERLAANPKRHVKRTAGTHPFENSYSFTNEA
ncbi:glucose-6-phosphate isomerase [bacterium]|nr:glucose-6-phosphate isomerase [bacterium]